MLNGEPVSVAISESVRRAIDTLGEPSRPGDSVERPLEASIEHVRRELTQSFSRTAAELEARLPIHIET